MKQKIYIIKVDDKYYFNKRTLVQSSEYAHKFYFKEQARRAIKRSDFADKTFEFIAVSEYDDIIY